MSCLQVLLAIIFPPLAVIDRGCGSVLIVFLLTCCGWVPGVIGALVILNKNNNCIPFFFKNLHMSKKMYLCKQIEEHDTFQK